MAVFRIFIFLFFCLPNLVWSAIPSQLVDTITKCYPANELKKEIKNEVQLRTDLQGQDLRLRMLGGYSQNEISQNNPERLQLGVNLRWEDITDNQNRREFQNLTGSKKEQEAKYLLENFWRMRMKDFYYWKWGRSILPQAESLLKFAQTKLEAGSDAFSKIAVTQMYSDLLELNRVTSEFKGRIETLNRNFDRCSGLKSWQEKLDFETSDLTEASKKNSSRLRYYSSICKTQKRLRTIGSQKEAGAWGLAFNTSFTRNALLQGERNQFNDIRAGLEVTIPISGAEAHEVKVDSCDYETKLIAEEDQIENNSAQALYPVMKTLEKQFHEMKKRLSLVNSENVSAGIETREIIQLALNIFNVHNSLATGEAKINAGILPAKIVEHEL